MYFFDCFRDGMEKDKLEEVCDHYGVSVDWDESMHAEGINSYLLLECQNRTFQFSEFPGNCSSLVLSDIENKPTSSDTLNVILNFCIKLCSAFEYALLFVSGTSEAHKKFFQEQGFEVVLDGVTNPHSGNDNYFAALNLTEERDA